MSGIAASAHCGALEQEPDQYGDGQAGRAPATACGRLTLDLVRCGLVAAAAAVMPLPTWWLLLLVLLRRKHSSVLC
jgi:hypothetical protein